MKSVCLRRHGQQTNSLGRQLVARSEVAIPAESRTLARNGRKIVLGMKGDSPPPDAALSCLNPPRGAGGDEAHPLIPPEPLGP